MVSPQSRTDALTQVVKPLGTGHSSTWARWFAVALPFALLIALLPVYWAGISTPSVGLYNDDGLYLVSAKALAEGHGYRIVSLPGAIWQTKYPPVYPFALALIWRIYPIFPANLLTLKAFSASFLFAWLALSYVFLALYLKIPKVAALWIVVLIAGTPAAIESATMLLSEALFGVFVFAALICAAEAERRTKPLLFAVLAAAFTAAAYYTRTAGVLLVPAIAIGLTRAGKYRSAAAAALLSVILMSGWSYWQSAHPATYKTDTQKYYHGVSYGDWNVISGPYTNYERIRVMYGNVRMMLRFPGGMFWLGLVPGLQKLEIPATLLISLCCVIGAFRSSLSSALVFVILSVCMIVVWTWYPGRFLLPLSPILLAFIYRGMPRMVRITFAAWAAIGIALAIPGTLRFTGQKQAISFDDRAPDWTKISKVQDWVKSNLPANAVIGANYDAAMYLSAGHISARFNLPSRRQLYHIESSPEAGTREILDTVTDWKMDYLVATGHDTLDDQRFPEMIRILHEQHRIRTIHEFGPGYAVYQVLP